MLYKFADVEFAGSAITEFCVSLNVARKATELLITMINASCNNITQRLKNFNYNDT